MMAALARWAMGVASNTEVGKRQHAARWQRDDWDSRRKLFLIITIRYNNMYDMVFKKRGDCRKFIFNIETTKTTG
jgi:hypothetical protein